MRIVLLAALIVAATALAGCSSGGGGKDRDGDGMYDSSERSGWYALVDTLDNRTRRQITSDPGEFDTDGDGLPDQEEFFLAIDARAADTDGDGLTDCQEVRHTVKAQCEDLDFSGPYDGGTNTDPAKQDSDPGASVYVLESEFVDYSGTLVDGRPASGDGIMDGEEWNGYTVTLASGAIRTIRTDPRNADSDEDGLDDGEERFLYRADPTVPDTDGDGCRDGFDPVPDQEERYSFGLRAFTLQWGGSADLVLTLLVANDVVHAPSTGSVAVQEGTRKDLSSQDPPPIRPSGDSCTYTPREPWVLIQAAAADIDATSRTLDISSVAPGAAGVSSDGAAVYWNVRTHLLSWSLDGTDAWPEAAGVTFQGSDGLLELHPSLRLPG